MAEISPIEVVQTLTKIIDEAVANSAAAKAVAQQQATEEDGKEIIDKPKRRQLALLEFYAPETLADAHARLEREISARVAGVAEHWVAQFPSPELDVLLEAVRSPGNTAAWCQALQARVIQVPGNGGCLYYSLHCCRTAQKLVGKGVTAKSYHSVEGNHYKTGVCETLLDHLDQMLSDGTLTLAELNQRYFGAAKTSVNKADRRKVLKAVRLFITDVAGANLGGKGLTRSQWAGDAELFAAVWFLREPLFILAQAADSSTTMRVIWLDRRTEGGPEHIVQLYPEAGEAYEYLRTFLWHRVLPTVIIHTTAGGGHYNTLRFREDSYTGWTFDDTTGAATRTRMDQVLAKLGWYVAPHKDNGIPKATITTVDSSGSLYEPSHPSLLSEEVFKLSPDAPLPPTAHCGLLSALNPRGRRRGVLAALWAQAERLKFQAYRMWDEEQPHPEPRTEPDSVEAGCVYCSTQYSQLVALLRALPYPEIALSLMRPNLLVRLGNELNDNVASGTVPDFIRAEDPVEARRQWVRLVALVVVVGHNDLTDLSCVDWLRHHPRETIAALHDIRLYNWTIVSTLAAASSPTQPTSPSASEPSGGARL